MSNWKRRDRPRIQALRIPLNDDEEVEDERYDILKEPFCFKIISKSRLKTDSLGFEGIPDGIFLALMSEIR